MSNGERGRPKLTNFPKRGRWVKFRDERLKNPEVRAAYLEAKERNKDLYHSDIDEVQ